MKTERDEDIILGIRSGGGLAEINLQRLYNRMRPLLLDFARKNMGTHDEALDLVQDTVVILYDQIRSGKYSHTGKLSAYAYSIARHLWLNRLKRKKIETKILETESSPDVQESPLETILQQENANSIRSVFQLIGQDCRQLLTYIIYDEMSMKEVCGKMQYENEQVVRNKKYKCLKQLKEVLSSRPDLLALLKSVYHG
jgi:RNA polymerase sigma factor (sigma-70 family)